MKLTIVFVVTAALLFATNPAWAQAAVERAAEVAAFKTMAAGIPLGSRIKLQTSTGRRMTATLMSATDEGIVVKRESRLPEPAVTIRYDELEALKRDERTGGFSIGKAIGVGLAAGVGAILTLFALAVALDD